MSFPSALANKTPVHFWMQVQTTGSLVFPPFRAEDYQQEVHAQFYRCMAQNSAGSIVSRDIHVRAGTHSLYSFLPFFFYLRKRRTKIIIHWMEAVNSFRFELRLDRLDAFHCHFFHFWVDSNQINLLALLSFQIKVKDEEMLPLKQLLASLFHSNIEILKKKMKKWCHQVRPIETNPTWNQWN